MNSDALFAAQLQAEELNSSRTQTQSLLQSRFQHQIEDAVGKVLSYEDELTQGLALSVMDVDSLRAQANDAASLSKALGEDPLLSEEDALALEILSWFKVHFFTWVDTLSCRRCGKETVAAGSAMPNLEEASYKAGRVELHYCKSCHATTRFPRYNDPRKLMETRRGRCGEWANAFTLCCRAAGLDARLVLDWTDHVWTEYYSHAQKRWIHLDPCEAIADKPLLYESGWGKSLSYCIAVGNAGSHDVTKRYTSNWPEVSQRRQVNENWKEQYLSEVTSRLRSGLTKHERDMLETRDEADEKCLLLEYEGRTNGKSKSNSNSEILPGRKTGSTAWIQSRGEGGSVENSSHEKITEVESTKRNAKIFIQMPGGSSLSVDVGVTNSVSIPTRYRRVPDTLNAVCRCSGDNPPSEISTKLFEECKYTKWLDFAGCRANESWAEYRLIPPNDAPRILESIELTSGNDAPERDPKHIAIDAWIDQPRESWVVIAETKNILFPSRGSVIKLPIRDISKDISEQQATNLRTKKWRLRIISVAEPQKANSVQLAGWKLCFAEESNPEACTSTICDSGNTESDNPWAALFNPSYT